MHDYRLQFPISQVESSTIYSQNLMMSLTTNTRYLFVLDNHNLAITKYKKCVGVLSEEAILPAGGPFYTSSFDMPSFYDNSGNFHHVLPA